MSDRLGPLEIDCDSPPYSIVRACHLLGIQGPEDVRWCRLSRFSSRRRSWREFLRQTWKMFLRSKKPEERSCNCGQKLPNLERCTFTLVSGKKVAYLIAQCGQCQTIFWEEA